VTNNKATEWMWGKQEIFILTESLWVLISKGQDGYVAEEKSKAVKRHLAYQ